MALPDIEFLATLARYREAIVGSASDVPTGSRSRLYAGTRAVHL